ncbi:nitrilase-related carbon-nitrogen hydrolase [Catenisphaera adipataccumulans]|jgi:omega-amidase|uniref:Putative amidohydrolase n=1 Tax=Catenisphaera adipataccumulans TaxID=700500 RepID=A0A7W8FWU8_9FIRM|nr:nitrilase-related carbon-nitrogen hydrolase [Catenisphaera adipataccumulans]MBB5182980.1 putative amidohydrolase [Catenisphaera adipataccumulans]
MNITMIQVPVTPSAEQNILYLQSMTDACKNSDIVVLPEMWNAPYDNEAMKKAADSQEKCMEAMRCFSKQTHTWLVGGSIPYKQGSSYYNMCLIYNDGQLISSYAKMHLMEFHGRSDYQEKDLFRAGSRLCLFDTPWGKMGVIICYDIRFPEEARLLAMNGAKIIFAPAAFNEKVGKAHWQPLFQTRAMENQVFMVGVNPSNYTYGNYTAYGHSIITDPYGYVLCQMDEKPGSLSAEIDLHRIDVIRKRMPLWQIRRDDVYHLDD